LKYLHWLRAISSALEAKGDGTGELKARQGSFPDVLPSKRIEQFGFVLASKHFSNVMMRRSILWWTFAACAPVARMVRNCSSD
jgi:hypothetical protein